MTRTSGGGYHATTGFTLAAKRENVVAEVVTREGDVLRFSTTNEDSTEVPTTFTWWWGTAKLAKINQPAVLKGTEDKTAVKLGEQEVQKNKDLLNAQGAATGQAIEAGAEVAPVITTSPGS